MGSQVKMKRFSKTGAGEPYWAAFLLLGSALVLGGASRVDVVVSVLPRLLGVVMLCYCLWKLPLRRRETDWWAVAIWGAMFLIPLLQLVPLPWSWWTELPGRTLPRQVYDYLGMTPARPISLTPDLTLYGLTALFAPLAAFLLAGRLERDGRRHVMKALLLLCFASAFLGLLQVIGGPTSPFYFYQISNFDSSVGFFANANHQAMFLCCGIVLVFLHTAMALNDPRARNAAILMALIAVAVLLISIVATRSRAGVGLAIFAILVGISMLPLNTLGPRKTLVRVAGGVLIGAIVITSGLAFSGHLFGGVLEFHANDSQRIGNLAIFARMFADFLPFGSGLGSFGSVYLSYEDLARLDVRYLNQAHNDFAQLAIETGIPGVLVLATFAIWWGHRAWQLVRNGHGGRTEGLIRYGALACTIILAVHSAVDYPLRTLGLSTLFAFMCAIMGGRRAGTLRKSSSPLT